MLSVTLYELTGATYSMTPKKKGPIQGSSTDIRAYNPLDLRVLAENMARVVLEQPVHPLGDVPSFKGAGVYIIYYTGDHHLYTAIAAKNRGGKWDQPIYIGEAARKGARKGGVLAEGPPRTSYLEPSQESRGVNSRRTGSRDCGLLVQISGHRGFLYSSLRIPANRPLHAGVEQGSRWVR